MTSEPRAPGAAAVILYRQVDRDDHQSTSHDDNYVRIKILKDEGRKYGNVEISYLKGETKVTHIKARTISPDGKIAEFDGQVFDRDLVKGKHVRYKAKTFALPKVEIGSIIEYSYTIEFPEGALYDSHWILSQDLFTHTAKFSLKPYQRYFHWSWQMLPPGAVPKQDSDGVVRMEASNIAAFPTEDYMPPENQLKARVDFIYESSNTESDSTKYWQKFGVAWNAGLETFIDKRRAMEDAVRQIVASGDAPEAKLRKIYARVQQLRNTSFEARKTEQEISRDKEKSANNVEDVWKRGYGTGRQLTWLFLALVRAAGFEAYGVWISSRSRYFFYPQQLDRSRLDNNVVLVKIDGKDVYCDPGTVLVPFGLLPWPETGVPGLRLDKDGGQWIKTALPKSSESVTGRRASLRLSEQGDLEGKLIITYSGLEAVRWRLEERNEDDATRKKALEEEARRYIPATSDVELAGKPIWDDPEQPLVAEFTLRIPGWASVAGRRAYLPVGIFGAQEKHLFTRAERVHPIYFEFPFQATDDISLQIPAGWEVASLPPAANQDGQTAGYHSAVEKSQGELHLTRSVNIDFLLLEQKYYPALRNFFQFVRSKDEAQVVLQPGTAGTGN